MPHSSKVTPVLCAIAVRTILILHNCLAVWRVGLVREHAGFWALAVGNIFTIFEGVFVVYFNGGFEWKWWCPCFLTYLLTTLPAVWLLQLSQYESLINSQTSVLRGRDIPKAAALASNSSSTFTAASMSVTPESTIQLTENPIEASIRMILSLKPDTWLILIQESLVYLLVFGRWILPRSSYSREALAELLLSFLAMASDIMELYAIFDEENVRGHLGLTYAILSVWSLSFFQFIPVFAHKRKFHHLQSARTKFIRQACGDYFAQVVVTCLSILLQDGPFLCLRLYIMTEFNLVTYSLVFFVLKNIVTLMLLFYRLGILCINLPCCYVEEKEFIDVVDVDFSAPVVLEKLPSRKHRHFNRHSTFSNSLNIVNFTVGAGPKYQYATFETNPMF